MIKPLDSVEKTISLIAGVSNTPENDVRERLRAEVREIGTYSYNCLKSQGIPLYETSEQLDALWRDSDAFLYEITVWNTCDAKHRMRSFVASRLNRYGFEKADVFCFGDGLGFDSTWLAMQGHHVQYYEPSLPSQQFAQKMFEENCVEVRKLDTLDDIARHSLDAIVCLDVLEHIPQPQTVVKQFHEWLKPEGLLFVHAPFWCIHWTRPTHLKENRHLSGDLHVMYHEQGFIEVDSSVFWDPILVQKKDSPSPLRKSPGAGFRIRTGQLLLTIGRWGNHIHNAVARRVARAPKSWLDALK